MKMVSIIVSLSFLLSGCTTASRLNDVSIGMTKSEVVNVMGKPASTSAQAPCEFMTYSLFDRVGGPYEPYYIRVCNGKVDAYGRNGDFMVPASRLIIENN